MFFSVVDSGVAVALEAPIVSEVDEAEADETVEDGDSVWDEGEADEIADEIAEEVSSWDSSDPS